MLWDRQRKREEGGGFKQREWKRYYTAQVKRLKKM